MTLTSRHLGYALGLLALGLVACGDISPVTTDNLCKQDPPNKDCTQCRTVPRDANCPQCTGKTPQAGCPNATDSGKAGNSATAGRSGAGGKGSGSGGTTTAGQSGGGSGAGGAGMDAGSDAKVDGGGCALCASDKPHCWAGTCVECTGDVDCTQSGKRHCEPTAHACVACVNKTHCGASKPECDPDQHVCVECLQQSDCHSASRPACEAGVCVACKSSGECTNQPGKALCDLVDGSNTKGQCVQCTVHADCANPTPQCTAHVCMACTSNEACTDLANPQCGMGGASGAAGNCVPCTGDAACSGRVGTTVCDTEATAPVPGKCVQCTGLKYAPCGQDSQSKSFVCESATRACSTTVTEKSTGLCGSCISDAQCFEGHLCVQQSFGTPAENVGNFCFWRKDASGPNNNCLNVRPFVGVKLAQTSMDKATADICGLRVTTCPGYEAFSQVNCESTQTPGTGDDALCGFPHPNTPDGYCRQDLSSNFRCTLPCGSDDDCLTGFTCNTSVVPAVCTL